MARGWRAASRPVKRGALPLERGISVTPLIVAAGTRCWFDYDTISPETDDDVLSPITKGELDIMLSRSSILPVVCFLAAALAGCTADKPAEPPPAPGVAPRAEQSPDLSPRTAVLTRNLGDAGIGDRVFFAYDSSLLSADGMRVLQGQAAWLKASPAFQLTVEGHADERGTRDYNLALGERRANAVRDYLIANGVAPDRVRTLSYGKERPQVAGHDESAWAQNRRGVSVVQ